MKSYVSTRSLFFCLILAVPLVFYPSPSLAQYVWHERNGHQYALTQNRGSWAEVEAEAQSQGGHLVTINDASENEWVANTFRDSFSICFGQDSCLDPWQAAVWIGYYRSPLSNVCTASWNWASGQVPFFPPPWSSDFPRGGIHAFLDVPPHPWAGNWGDNYYNDQDPAGQFKGVIEREPPTYRLSLLQSRVNIRIRASEENDSFELSGFFRLSRRSNGVFPATEEVAIRMGNFSTRIPAGEFVAHGKALHYKGLEGAARLKVTIAPTGTRGVYRFEVCLMRGELESTTLKPAIQLVIGDDSGQSILEFGQARFIR